MISFQAAQFGKTFVDGYDPTEYVRMTRVLRVLNTARSPKIGILLTYPQYPFSICPTPLKKLSGDLNTIFLKSS